MFIQNHYLKQTIIFIVTCCCLSSCSYNSEVAINNSQEANLFKENASTTPSETTQQDCSSDIVPTVIAPSEVPKSTQVQDTQLNEYYDFYKEDGSTYKMDVIHDEQHNYTIKLFDESHTELQTVELGWCPGGVELLDVNTDGYTDIVVNTGGTVNETHDLYIWNSVSDNFVKVSYEGFDILAWFTVHEGYIENFIRGSSPEDSIKQKLIWEGNTLSKESEEY